MMTITQSPAGDPRGKPKSRTGQPERDGRRTQIGKQPDWVEADPLVREVIGKVSAQPNTTRTPSVPLQVSVEAAPRSHGDRVHLNRRSPSGRRCARATRSKGLLGVTASEGAGRTVGFHSGPPTGVVGPSRLSGRGGSKPGVDLGRHAGPWVGGSTYGAALGHPKRKLPAELLARRAVESYRDAQYT